MSSVALPYRTCGICGVRDIPRGIEWPWWANGECVHLQCLDNGTSLSEKKPPMTIPSYTRHPEYKLWMRAIRANPADDLVRLQYADWLDEQVGSCEVCGGKAVIIVSGYPKCPACHGTGTNGAAERAEFIRLSIEDHQTVIDFIAYLKVYDTNSIILPRAVFPRVFNWSQKHNDTYLRAWTVQGLDLQTYVGDEHLTQRNRDGMMVWWRRGFISHVRCTLAQFEQHAGEIGRHHPVTTWEITDLESPYERLNTPPLAHEYYWLTMPFGMSSPPALARPFPTREAALEAHNAACILVANQWAEIIESGGMVNTEFEAIYGLEESTPHI